MTRCEKATAVVADVQTVYENLQAALHQAGITLPSLCVDPVSFADRDRAALLDLGRCNQETARQLTAALTGQVR